MSSNDAVAVTAIWTDHQNTLEARLPGSGHTVAMAVGILQNHISKHVSKPSDSLSVCRSAGFATLFAPNAETNIRIWAQLARKAQANQTAVEPNTTLATDTATTTQSSVSAVPHRKYTLTSLSAAKKARKRNAASTANPASMANLPQVTMDRQLKEMPASMQNDIAEIRGKNERILDENGSMHGEIERILKENQSINNDLASVRKDLEAARVKHIRCNAAIGGVKNITIFRCEIPIKSRRE
ncbi:hypothetical protein DFJ58DRAFT_849706 [Suillus subalutaceus]|uniref:uncharacterized protein n=1 Tax=Suillus subalutaceus TaxID=48586 RepID=UPI001B86180F|nr:uncharacterized protein DFJ58DRAFT_849706 [Suillus subalutaceus]KAG1824256.1 hypothetical protein DFJ58DRAFT_849706 [Suillus subalutaceus]